MLWEILKASKGILVADFYADLWANIAGGGTPVDVFAEMIGALPLYYNGKGYDLTDYLISGNAVQDGTPSADATVDATGSGVRTGNLFDVTAETVSLALQSTTGKTSSSEYSNTSDYIPISGTFTITLYSDSGNIYRANSRGLCFYNASKEYISGIAYDGHTNSVRNVTISNVPNDCRYIRLTHDKGVTRIMLNTGDTAIPYEPYGYKLPLTANGVEYPIYLGQVETTRRVKKLVLTGEEVVYEYANADIAFRINTSDAMISYRYCACTHFPYQRTPGQSTIDGVTAGAGDKNLYFTFSTSSAAAAGIVAGDVNSFKSYLSAQYANGTPVTVWYVLAEPETAVVNEPLHKIGNYADTISFAQAGVAIPTVNGANVLDMTSPVKPSEMYIKGKGIKPTGYGQLTDVNSVNILDKDGRPIYVHGQ